jgi:FtsH-binding integral membrane protein
MNTNYPPSYEPNASSQPLVLTNEAVFFQKIYTWMCAALAVTAIVGYLLSRSSAWEQILRTTPFLWIGIFILQIGIVLGIGFLRDKVSSLAIKGLFLFYAVSVGLTLSIVVMVYPSTVIAKAFFCTAGIYGAMAL